MTANPVASHPNPRGYPSTSTHSGPLSEESTLASLTEALLAEVPTLQRTDPVARPDVDDHALVRLVNHIIAAALEHDASDLHIEPQPEELHVRIRRDGILHPLVNLPTTVARAFIARLKIMGNLDIAERRLPQDGRVTFEHEGASVDLRISTLPTLHGEKAVLRLLKRADVIPGLEQLGFLDDTLTMLRSMIALPHGLLLMTGPTGSGKSFTAFSILKALATPSVNILTIEDPVEYQLPSLQQTQVNTKAGLTFARALRAFLRQDPDIILVGEIRDAETAQIALEAAMTGHLVLATLHTNDAPSTVTRLTELGVERFQLASALIGVIAQRLVRAPCSACGTDSRRDPKQRPFPFSQAHVDFATMEQPIQVSSDACRSCGGSGFRGRRPLHEVLEVNDEIEESILKGESAREIRRAAREAGMRTLREDGLIKAEQGRVVAADVMAMTTQR